jgi:cyclohexanecarboxylate-CoA ligase
MEGTTVGLDMIRTATLWDLIDARAKATPDALFGLDETGREMTFAGYRDAAERLAGMLHESGVKAGSSVSWILPTGFNALVLLAALSRLGAVQNPIIPIYRGREVSHCLRETQGELLIVQHEYRGFGYEEMANEIATKQSDLQVLIAPTSAWEDEVSPELAAKLPPPPDDASADEVRWIFYTSGTTSDPKGARHTDRGFLRASFGLAEAMDLRPSDRIGLVFPVTHLGGVNSLVAALATGAGHLVVEAFNPPETIPFLAKHGVTHAGAGTAFHQAYLAAQRAQGSQKILPDVRAFQGGGAPKPPQLHYDLLAECGAGIVSVYGMTECPVVALGKIGDPEEKLANTEGRLNIAETELRIVKSDGSLGGTNEEGELRLRAPQIFSGYVDERLNAEAFDEDGFYRTGDLGFIDDDGYITISGRLKDVIIRKGENISAQEIEDLLSGHPEVADVAVIGVPDETRGEMVCAVVTALEGGEPVTLEEVVRYLKDAELMMQKIPERLEVVDALPRNPTGKILKRVLRDQFGG